MKKVLFVLAVMMSGCAGVGFRVEGYRIDEIGSHQSTKVTPLKCYFVSCTPGSEASAVQGS